MGSNGPLRAIWGAYLLPWGTINSGGTRELLSLKLGHSSLGGRGLGGNHSLSAGIVASADN
jgi:hypothetical protein